MVRLGIESPVHLVLLDCFSVDLGKPVPLIDEVEVCVTTVVIGSGGILPSPYFPFTLPLAPPLLKLTPIRPALSDENAQ